MKERLQIWFNTIKEKWRNFTKRQKLTIIGIFAGLIIALILTLFLALNQTWVTITYVPSLGVGHDMQNALSDAGINSNLSASTNALSVTEANADQAIILLSSLNQFAQEDFNFMAFLEQSGMGVTAVAQHNMLVQVRQTWLNNVLPLLDGIDNAAVQLNIPQTTPFILSAPQASASVMVSSSRNLTAEDGRIIAQFVARSSEGLLPDNITVIDSNMNELWPAPLSSDGVSGSILTVQSEFVRQREIRAASSAQTILSPITDVAEVAVNMTFNWDTSVTTQEIFQAPDGSEQGLPSQLQTSLLEAMMEDGGGPGIGVPGADGAGIPGGLILDALGGGTGNFSEDTFNAHFLQNRTFIQTELGTGVLVPEESSVAVTATRFITYNQSDLIELGVIDNSDSAWLQFQNENQAEFLQEDEITILATDAVRAATGIENVVLIMQAIPIFVPIAPAAPINFTQIALFALAIIFVSLLAFQLIRRTKPELSPIDIEPELSVEDLLVSSQLDEEKTEMERLAEIKFNQDSQVKEQIDKFATEKPDSVAQLLRNWINEDWE